jgi:uridylate kinase
MVHVIKLGGSLISRSMEQLFDFEYLAQFKQAMLPSLEQGNKYCIILGGGYVMRKYRDMAIAAGISEKEQQHWIGTTVNVLHGEIVRAYFNEWADPGVLKYEEYYNNQPLTIAKNLKIGGGGRPGHSGDVDAVLAAQKVGASRIYSLKNIDGVYDSDPKLNPQAKRQDKLTWDEYLTIIGHKTEHEPGGNYPIDPIASRMAQEAGLEFIVVGGDSLQNVQAALKGESFLGTTVK